LGILFQKGREPTDDVFLFFRDNAELERQREHLECLWQRYEPYADSHFLVEIGQNFHERYWEMALAVELMDQSLTLVPRGDRSNEGPDLCVAGSATRVWIEAVAPGPGTGPDAVDFSETEGGWVPSENIILRYQSAVADKLKKLRIYSERGLMSDSDRTVIAVYGRKIPAAVWGDRIPYPVQAVLPIGPLGVTIDRSTGEVIREGYGHRRFIKKKSGSRVSTTTFVNPENSDLSAIISGNPDPMDTGSCPLMVIHNPVAEYALPRAWLSTCREYWVENEELRSRRLPESV